MFEPPPRKTRAELIKDINADYYGFLDKDGVLVSRERQQERCAVSPADWPTVAAARTHTCRAARPSEEAPPNRGESNDEEPARFAAHVPVPTKWVVEATLRSW